MRATLASVTGPAAGVKDTQHEAQEGRGGLTVKAGVGRAPALHSDQPLGALIDGAVGERVIAARPARGEEVKWHAARRGGALGRLQHGASFFASMTRRRSPSG